MLKMLKSLVLDLWSKNLPKNTLYSNKHIWMSRRVILIANKLSKYNDKNFNSDFYANSPIFRTHNWKYCILVQICMQRQEMSCSLHIFFAFTHIPNIFCNQCRSWNFTICCFIDTRVILLAYLYFKNHVPTLRLLQMFEDSILLLMFLIVLKK